MVSKQQNAYLKVDFFRKQLIFEKIKLQKQIISTQLRKKKTARRNFTTTNPKSRLRKSDKKNLAWAKILVQNNAKTLQTTTVKCKAIKTY